MRRSKLAWFLTAAVLPAVLLALAWSAPAQTDPPKQADPPKPAEPVKLTTASLKKLLDDLGEDPKTAAGNPSRLLLYKQKDIDGLSFNIVIWVELSSDNSRVWFTAPWGGLPHPETIPPSHLFEMLKANDNLGGSYLACTQTNVNLVKFVENRGIDKKKMRKELDGFLDDLTKSSRGWNYFKWPPFPGQVASLPHGSTVRSVAASSDGKRAISVGQNGELAVWDLGTQQQVARFAASKVGVLCVALSADGKQAFTGDATGAIVQWDLEGQKEVRKFEGHKHNVWGLAVSKDGKRLVSAGGPTKGQGGKYVDAEGKEAKEPDFSVRVWEIDSAKQVQEMRGHTNMIFGVALTADGKTAATAGYDNVVRLWDADKGTELRKLEGFKGLPQAVAFAPDGKVLTGSLDKVVRLWDAEKGTELRKYEGRTRGVWTVAASPDGKQVLSSGHDRSIRLWDIETGKQLKVFGGHYNAISRVAFLPDGKKAVSGGWDTTVRVWDLTK